MISRDESSVKSGWKKEYGDTPVVSIRCTVYNHTDYVEKTLDGFLMQITDFPFEIVVHDDASTDGSADIIRKYVEKYPSLFKPILQTENQHSKGRGRVGEIVMPYLTGKYTAFCEGDDYWTDEHKLQKQVDYMESHPECGLCSTDFDIYHQDEGNTEKSVLKNRSDKYRSDYDLEKWIIKPGYTGPMTWLFRREVFAKCFEEATKMKSPDGTFVWFAYALANSNVYCLKEDTTAVYRILAESAAHTNNIEKSYSRVKALYKTRLELAKKYGLSEDAVKAINDSFYKRAYKQMAIVNDKEELAKAKAYNNSLSKKVFFLLTKIGLCRLFLRRLWTKKKKQY
ncbi:glycosyltransferase [Ruminococcus sp.]|uniref:glycosyltransferase n=1 Tax=Ruminococcus sp. TaxID=41978 RepID=UPI002C67489B|nr:glycosyltransferase [Ruminococcus sp.]HNZ98453.1 glycosyltransferase [Ruminococcus sp.]HOH85733.1 glycosyltransferase [Ruminococcus sp.]